MIGVCKLKRDLLSLSQGIFPPLLTFVREVDGRCPIVSFNCVYAGVPGNSLNRERETANLNEEKLKPRGKNELQRFTKTCEEKSISESYSPCVQLKQAFLCCYQCSDFSLAGQLSGLGCGEFLLILALFFMPAMNSQYCQGNLSLQISQG